MSVTQRLALVGLPTLALWCALIVQAAPREPAGPARAVFFASMAVALGASIWATWPAMPQHAGKPWRRPVNIALGLVAFCVLVTAGHLLGATLAAQLK